ncbi:TPA: restriction endonuclease subunit S [Neisseria meningitidis]
MDIQSKAKKLIEMIQTAPVEWKPLGEVASIGKGKQLNKSLLREKDKYPVINGGINPSGYWHEYNNEAGTIVISQGGASAGFVNWMDIPFLQELTHILLKRTKTNYCNGLHIIFKNEANYIHAMSIRSRYTSTC